MTGFGDAQGESLAFVDRAFEGEIVCADAAAEVLNGQRALRGEGAGSVWHECLFEIGGPFAAAVIDDVFEVVDVFTAFVDDLDFGFACDDAAEFAFCCEESGDGKDGDYKNNNVGATALGDLFVGTAADPPQLNEVGSDERQDNQ